MSPNTRLRHRMHVVLNMAMAFVITILLAQLWLFTVALEVMETRDAPEAIAVAALVVSFLGCAAVWVLIRFFLRAERS